MTDVMFSPKPVVVRDDALSMLEKVADMRNVTVADMMAEWVNSYAPAPSYKATTPQPGDTVLSSEDDWTNFRAKILGSSE
ncbi:hypothetical protein [Bifidobacterium eulemuris]|uniref:Antitoxin n=1 Tax=Bifidobacterium eulemuris TaxID=1765219 RepID=A0A261GC99_9BIFI|nr:hypothetical protein [Bifidobacterium eulemuris]OZG69042.1 hypothetical protein BEUL_0448 [Bifidobacterium eulemuris]QOL31432.1 hypothetical protein BE0216_02385 [Bifidobacterium eulemuris]